MDLEKENNDMKERTQNIQFYDYGFLSEPFLSFSANAASCTLLKTNFIRMFFYTLLSNGYQKQSFVEVIQHGCS